MTKYTADDFANAKFAEHPDGLLATRSDPDDIHKPWADGGGDWFSDQAMVDDGWVPVPTKPTITESQFARAVVGVWGDEGSGPTDSNGFARGFLFRLGINVDPDPEPTDEELLAGIIRNIDDWQSITSPELLAKYLNTAGVTPPKENN